MLIINVLGEKQITGQRIIFFVLGIFEKVPGLLVVSSLLTAIVALYLAGGPITGLARFLGLIAVSILLAFVIRTQVKIYLEKPAAGFVLSFLTLIFITLALSNYTPVVYGGQDPGYYTAFAKVLEFGLGSPFSSNLFENNSLESVNLPSTFTTGGKTEIQFYPLLPASIAALTWLFGDYSYVVIGILSALSIQSAILRKFVSVNPFLRTLISCFWIFIPATLWFARVPTSEVISSALLAAFLLWPLWQKSALFVRMLVMFFLGASMLLTRANPVLILLLAIIGLWQTSRTSQKRDLRLVVFQVIIPLVLAAVYSSYLYYVHLPRFFSEIFTAIYGPHIGTAIYATIIALVATAFFFWANRVSAKFKTLTSNWLGERNLNKVLWLSCALLLAFATYKVLFTSDWGEYNPEQFGVSDELDERFTRTGLLFIFSSFGLLVFCISRSRTSFQNLLLALCGISLAVILMRNPAIPIPYFYERYWWSEFGLILLLIAADSMNRNSLGVIGKNMTSAAVMISLAFNLTYFDFSISREVEGGIDGKFTVILEKLKSLGYSQLYFKSDEDIWWLSGFVVPLRYTYGIKVSDQRALAHAEKLDTPYVTQLGCGSDKELLNLNFSIDRLRRFSSIDTLGWVENGTSIFMCKSLQ